MAVAILFLWAAAITAGRLTAYDDAHAQRQTALGTLIVSAVLLVAGYVAIKLYGWIRASFVGHAAEALKPQKASR